MWTSWMAWIHWWSLFLGWVSLEATLKRLHPAAVWDTKVQGCWDTIRCNARQTIHMLYCWACTNTHTYYIPTTCSANNLKYLLRSEVSIYISRYLYLTIYNLIQSYTYIYAFSAKWSNNMKTMACNFLHFLAGQTNHSWESTPSCDGSLGQSTWRSWSRRILGHRPLLRPRKWSNSMGDDTLVQWRRFTLGSTHILP